MTERASWITNPEDGSRAEDVTVCRACPRLVAWREASAARVPRRFVAWVESHGFWARPVPAFGDSGASLAIVGLAPAAQGGNRTGRMFTGDRSGDFLWAALTRAGLANQAESTGRHDGLRLEGALITAAARCAPPDNRLLPEELSACRRFLGADLSGMPRLAVVLALGAVAHEAVLALGARDGGDARPRPRFAHGREHALAGGLQLVDSYHVSQRNTFTGLLTAAMLDAVLQRCLELCRVAGGAIAPVVQRPSAPGSGGSDGSLRRPRRTP